MRVINDFVYSAFLGSILPIILHGLSKEVPYWILVLLFIVVTVKVFRSTQETQEEYQDRIDRYKLTSKK